MGDYTTIKLKKDQAKEIDEIIDLLLKHGTGIPEIQEELLAIRKESRGVTRPAIVFVAVRVLKVMIEKHALGKLYPGLGSLEKTGAK